LRTEELKVEAKVLIQLFGLWTCTFLVYWWLAHRLLSVLKS